MAFAFTLLALVSSVLLFVAAGAGIFHLPNHMLWAIGAAVASISCHCLVFAIFTGSGKDTRLLVEDWKLDPEFVRRTKVFKKEVFPPALYAIGWFLLATLMAGLVAKWGALWMRWVHGLVGGWTIYYNLKTFLMERSAIVTNASLLKRVNEVAAETTTGVAPQRIQFDEATDKVLDLDFETHVFAFGKFLSFMGYNVWLVFLYVKYIMGMITTPWWPFVVSSLCFFGFGFYLQSRYRRFQPQ